MRPADVIIIVSSAFRSQTPCFREFENFGTPRPVALSPGRLINHETYLLLYTDGPFARVRAVPPCFPPWARYHAIRRLLTVYWFVTVFRWVSVFLPSHSSTCSGRATVSIGRELTVSRKRRAI